MLPPLSAPVSIPTHMAGFALARFSIRLARSPQFLLSAPFLPSSSGFLQSMPVGDLGFVGDFLPDRFGSVKMYAVNKNDGPKWWERNPSSNMIDVHSTEDFLNALNQAEDKLVMVEFYGTWCASCKALFPKLCRTVAAHSEILFLKVNFDENKPMCKRLNVKVLPYFHFYRGADGLLEAFSCSLPKFQKIKDAIATHTTARCSIGPPASVGDLNFLEASMPVDTPAESSPT